MKSIVICIDGQLATGKGTLAQALCNHYGAVRLDSGAIYRVAALYLQDLGYNLDAFHELDDTQMAEVCDKLQTLPIDFVGDENGLQVLIAGQDRTAQVRQESTGNLASKISSYQPVRQALLQCQRDFALKGEILVADGRDMGTAVFPQAPLKFFLECDGEVAMQRRILEMQNAGQEVDIPAYKQKMRERMERDVNRAVNPTVAAADAIIIDTTDLNAQEVFAQAVQHVEQVLAAWK